jgi:hypothetical protein
VKTIDIIYHVSVPIKWILPVLQRPTLAGVTPISKPRFATRYDQSLVKPKPHSAIRIGLLIRAPKKKHSKQEETSH